MDREIKFRGKVIKGYQESFFKQKFVYGNVIYCEDDIHSTIINDEFEATVDTDSVGQFTGFYDINDVEIYEGDIVTNKRGNYKYYITFENGSFVCYHLNMVDQVNGGNMRTEFQRLIDDLEELKSTKLYENSFKVIDDCIHLLYSRKNYFEKLEFLHTIRNSPKDENKCVYGTDFDENRMCSRCGNFHF